MIADNYLSIYDNHKTLGGFNMEPNIPILISFMQFTVRKIPCVYIHAQ